jgi:hypothetical protein
MRGGKSSLTSAEITYALLKQIDAPRQTFEIELGQGRSARRCRDKAAELDATSARSFFTSNAVQTDSDISSTKNTISSLLRITQRPESLLNQ